jgi:hypothetical protein
MVKQLDSISISSSPASHEDLYAFVQRHIFQASVSALFGKAIFDINPNFCENFWQFEDVFRTLPKDIRDGCYVVRIKLETYAFRKFESGMISLMKINISPGEEEYIDAFGSNIVQHRHNAFAKMEIIDPNTKASEERVPTLSER